MADDNNDYEIGYRKPPAETQFKPGSSGNPKGRPKGSKSLTTVFAAISREQVMVTRNNRQTKITMLEAVLYQISSKAASGDLKAVREFLQLCRMLEAAESAEDVAPEATSSEADLLKSFLKRVERMGTRPLNETATDNAIEPKQELE